MEQASVLNNIAPQCEHFPESDDGTIWMVRERGRTVGHLRFQSGKLRLVMKEWTNDAKTPVDVGDAVYFLAHHLETEGCTNGRLISSQVDEPDHNIRRFEVVCGRKALRLTATHSKVLGDFLEIEEVLFRPSLK
jgi:hypothetical protein